MLTVGCSLQTGDPGLETGDLRLLKEEKSPRLENAADYDPKPSIKLTHYQRCVAFNSASFVKQ